MREEPRIRIPERFARLRESRLREMLEELSLPPTHRHALPTLLRVARRVRNDRALGERELLTLYRKIHPSLRDRAVPWVAHPGAGPEFWREVLADFPSWDHMLGFLITHPRARALPELTRAVVESGNENVKLLLLYEAREEEEVARLIGPLIEEDGGRSLSQALHTQGIPEHWRENRALLAQLLTHPNPELRLLLIRFLGKGEVPEEERRRQAEAQAEQRSIFAEEEPLWLGNL